jgi:hypothetical protein
MVRKLGSREMSGKTVKALKIILPKYFTFGGSFYMLYWILRDFQNFEANNLDYPQFFKHEIAISLTGFFAGSFGWGLLKGGVPLFWFSMIMAGPTIWFLHLMKGRTQAGSTPNIFYENGVDLEEMQRIKSQDHIEMLAKQMRQTPSYGYASYRDQRHANN